MKRQNSPSQHIYKLYNEYEKSGMDSALVSQTIQQVSGTRGMSNLEVVEKWLKEIVDSMNKELF